MRPLIHVRFHWILTICFMASGYAAEDALKKNIVVPPVGSMVKVELIDHTKLQGKLVAQKSDCVHLQSNSTLLVVSFSNLASISSLQAPVEKEKEAAARTDVKSAEEEEEEIEAPASKPEKNLSPAEIEKALAQKLLGGNQAKPSTATLPEKREKGEKPAEGMAKDMNHVLDQAVENLADGRFLLAISSFRRIANSKDPQLIANADNILRARFHRNLADTMAICYMQEPCPDCKGTGSVVCPDCGGQGYISRLITRTPNERVEPGTRKLDKAGVLGIADNATDKSFMRDQLCAKCRGHGFDPCETCRGTRCKYSEPSPYEKSAYSDYLASLGDESLKEKESSYGDTGRSSPPTYETREEARLKPMLQQVWLRDSANQVKSDIQRLWRAHQYYTWAIKADPSLLLRSTQKNYSQELTKLQGRLRLLYGEFSERQQVYMNNRAENRLDELNYYEYFGKNASGGNATGLEKFKEILTDQ